VCRFTNPHNLNWSFVTFVSPASDPECIIAMVKGGRRKEKEKWSRKETEEEDKDVA
jgi:hypothetical protein